MSDSRFGLDLVGYELYYEYRSESNHVFDESEREKIEFNKKMIAIVAEAVLAVSTIAQEPFLIGNC